MFKLRVVAWMALILMVLCATPWANAAVVSQTFTGAITSWVDNSAGITPDTNVSLAVSYDKAWISQKYDSYRSSLYNVINIIDYYNQGARLTLQIGNLPFVEMRSENPVPVAQPIYDYNGQLTGWTYGALDWQGSIPYMLFDNNKNPIGFTSQWLADDPSGLWSLNVGVYKSNVVDITIRDNTTGKISDVYASVNFVPVPLPSALLLFSSGLLSLLGVIRARRRA